MAVRSTRLFTAAHGSTTQATDYTVPAGFRTILKTVTVVCRAAATLTLSYRNSTTAQSIDFYKHTFALGETALLVNLFVVLHTGDAILSTQDTASAFFITASGAELAL